ncbi:MAG: hypothetical protein EOP48_32790 [Sphingobacteriales bacterium]|nr:MAG: hypothetical protein EOP48_32790 [Sphingobacteriales bacterium]
MRFCLSVIAVTLILSCTASNGKFNQNRWLNNPGMNDWGNPRIVMLDDLMSNHLYIGMSRDSILMLLGKPYEEKIEMSLPDDMKIPDSISFAKEKNLRPGRADTVTYLINEFSKKNSQPDTVMMYALGPSMADYWFLKIVYDNKGRVRKYYKYQS